METLKQDMGCCAVLRRVHLTDCRRGHSSTLRVQDRVVQMFCFSTQVLSILSGFASDLDQSYLIKFLSYSHMHMGCQD